MKFPISSQHIAIDGAPFSNMPSGKTLAPANPSPPDRREVSLLFPVSKLADSPLFFLHHLN
jgi:hypothetical protein